MLETSQLPKGEKGKKKIKKESQFSSKHEGPWPHSGIKVGDSVVAGKWPWMRWSLGGLARGAVPKEDGEDEEDGEDWDESCGCLSEAGLVPAPPCAGSTAVFPSLEAGICHPSRYTCGNAPKKLLPAGETLGQELWGHPVSLHHHLNQLECRDLALGGSPQLRGASNPDLLDHGGGNRARAPSQGSCSLPSARGVLSKEETQAQRCLLSRDQRQLRENLLG